MNRNRPRSDRSDAGFVKRVVLAVIGLMVVIGVGVLVIGQSGPSPRDSRLAAAARPATALPPADEGTPVAEPAVTDSPPAPVAMTSREPATWVEAQAAWDAGEWGQAADLFASYTEAHEGNAWGWFMTGLALRQDGRFAEAESALQHCLEIDPNHGKALLALARVRLSLDRADDALEPIETAVTRDPESVDAQRVLGRVLHTLGRRDEAERAYETALSIDPDDAWSNNNLGLLRIEGERFAEAVEPLQRACAVGSGQAVFFNNLGVALERTGRYRAAEQAYAQAVELAPEDSKASISLARVTGLGGDVDEPTGVLVESAAPEDSTAEVAPVRDADADAMALAEPELPEELAR